jgi:hypothetical protein
MALLGNVGINKPRVYIDTSVVGGFFDIEFKVDSQRLFQNVSRGTITIVVSAILLFEL